MNLHTHRVNIFNTLLYYLALIFNIFLGWIITRLNTDYLEVNAYGQFAFFVTLILFAKSLFGLGVFESTSRLLALSKNRNERKNILGTSLLWALIFAFFATFALFLSSELIGDIFKVKIGALCQRFSYGLGLYVLLSHLSLSLRGSGQIKILSFMAISPRIFYLILLIIIILEGEFNLSSTLEMMFWGLIISLAMIWLMLKPIFSAVRETSHKLWNEVKSYGRHIYISTIWSELLIHTDKFLISFFLDSKAMAYYGLAFALAFPLSHFSTSLSTSLFQRFANEQRINPKVIMGNQIFVTITVVLFIILREPIILYLFSEQYMPTIDLLMPLALAFGFSGLSKPYTLYLMAQKQGKIVRNISILIPTLQTLISIIIIPIYGVLGVAWVASFIYLLDFLLYLIFYYRVIRLIQI